MGEGFWHLDIGNIITALLVLAAVITAWARLGARAEEQARDLARITEQILRMDTQGTRWSQRGLGVESELTRSSARRLDNHDQILSAIPASVAAMQTDLHWIKEYMRKHIDEAS